MGGGATLTVTGIVFQMWPLTPLGLIFLLMGTSRLGVFPRPRIRTHEEQAKLNRIATFINVAAPLCAVLVVALSPANPWGITVLVWCVLTIDIAYYTWVSRLGAPA